MYIYIINQFYNCQSKEYTNYSMYTKVAIVAEAILYKLWTCIRKQDIGKENGGKIVMKEERI